MSGDDGRPLVSILVPAFNEAGIIEPNLARICNYTDGLRDRYRWELIVIDDGSADDTADRARAFAAQRDDVTVLQHPMNFHLGQALRYGFGQCRGEQIVVLDVDLSYAPEHIEIMLERMRETKAKIVIASPYMKGGRTTKIPFLRRFLSRWGNRFLALMARGKGPGENLVTLTGMVRAYDTRFIRSLDLMSMGMEINTEIIYKALILQARIEEIPAHLDWSEHDRTGSIRSSGKRIPRGIMVALLAGFIIRPFAFFIIPGLLLALASVYVLAWTLYHVVSHYDAVAQGGGNFDQIISESLARAFQQAPHAFIVGGITLLLAVQLFSFGVLALQLRQYFEQMFHLGTRVYAQSRELERLRDEQVAANRSAAGRREHDV